MHLDAKPYHGGMTQPFIMVATTGARKTKADHPQIPISIADTVAVAKTCFEAGADAIHLHIRDTQECHSIDTGLYQEALAELAQALPKMDVQVSSRFPHPADVGCPTPSRSSSCAAGVIGE